MFHVRIRSGGSVVVVCSRDDTGALRLQTPASPIFPSVIRDYAVELRGFEPRTFSLRTRCSAELSYSPIWGRELYRRVSIGPFRRFLMQHVTYA